MTQAQTAATRTRLLSAQPNEPRSRGHAEQLGHNRDGSHSDRVSRPLADRPAPLTATARLVWRISRHCSPLVATIDGRHNANCDAMQCNAAMRTRCRLSVCTDWQRSATFCFFFYSFWANGPFGWATRLGSAATIERPSTPSRHSRNSANIFFSFFFPYSANMAADHSSSIDA